MDETTRVHGSCVALDGTGFLFVGASGSGKSGLALQMMSLGATLVSDDQVLLTRDGDHLVAHAPEAIRGKIEARFLGLLNVDHAPSCRLQYVVDLDQSPEGRLPKSRKFKVLDANLPLIAGKSVPNLAQTLSLLARGAVLP